MKQRGIVAAFGNAAGEQFTTSIYPFILRSVTLAGVNANHPVASRGSAWRRMTGDLRPQALDKIVHRISFAELPAHCEALINGGVRGRAVVCFS
jgi:acrylyl-CoA reductase (NADPH)